VEYIVLAKASNQAKWYCSYLSELSYKTPDPIPLYGNNKGAIVPDSKTQQKILEAYFH
jgi:hypothetical protein